MLERAAEAEARKNRVDHICLEHVERAQWRLAQQQQPGRWRRLTTGAGWAMFGGGAQGLIAEFLRTNPDPLSLAAWFILLFCCSSVGLLHSRGATLAPDHLFMSC